MMEIIRKNEKATCTSMFIAVLSTIAKHPRCPTADEWKKKISYLHTMEFYSVIKKS
jgi:hypothetical protein